MQKNENPLVLSGVLLVISLIVALLLSFTNAITKDKIAENALAEQDAAKQEVLKEANEFENLNYKDGIVSGVYLAKDGEKSVGWCVNVKPNGYGGAIDIMVGITEDFKLSGVKVISNSETAGLGAKCTEDDFSGQFCGKETPINVIKNGTPRGNEIVAITGATITSKAVTDGVNSAFEAVKNLGGGINE